MRLFYHCAADDGAVLEHVLKVDKVTVVHVLSIVVGIVEMNDTVFMSLDNIGWQKNSLGKVFGHLACHIVTLNTVDSGVFVGIFLLYLFVVALNKA